MAGLNPTDPMASRLGKNKAVITAQEARRLDFNAQELGVPVVQLMANAGKALARAVSAVRGRGRTVVVLCGKGNNGGDGFAAAALLRKQGWTTHVVLAEAPHRIRSAAARHHLASLNGDGIVRWRGRVPPEVAKAGILLDCLLGSGLPGTPKPPYVPLIGWVNRRRKAGAVVISCDVPSGLGSAVAVRPTRTVTLHAPKPGMTSATCGRIHIMPIGIPAAARHIGLGDLEAAYVRPAQDSHKGSNGVILVVAGSLPLAGAAHYVAQGALRTGADLVHIATPDDAAPAIRSWGPHAIVHGVNPGPVLTTRGVDRITQLMERCDALVIGPGLGTTAATRRAARTILALAADAGKPIVVDADALDALDDDLLARAGHRMVLTPHAREFLDLAGRTATPTAVRAYARRHGVTVLRKAAVDVVADAQRQRTCHHGHPTLTVGGTGDVLAGAVATLLAKGAEPFAAACAGSYLVKSAGEVAAGFRSYGATATDVAEAIPSVLLRLS